MPTRDLSPLSGKDGNVSQNSADVFKTDSDLSSGGSETEEEKTDEKLLAQLKGTINRKQTSINDMKKSGKFGLNASIRRGTKFASPAS